MSEQYVPKIPFHHSAETLAGLIYGVVTAMAVITVLAGKDANALYMALAAFGTALALALTYLYSHWLSGTFSDETGHGGARHAWRRELPTLVGSIVLGLVMILVEASGARVVVAAESAMWVGTFLLFVLGFRIALQAGRRLSVAVGFGLLDAVFGALLVLIKVLVH